MEHVIATLSKGQIYNIKRLIITEERTVGLSKDLSKPIYFKRVHVIKTLVKLKECSVNLTYSLQRGERYRRVYRRVRCYFFHKRNRDIAKIWTCHRIAVGASTYNHNINKEKVMHHVMIYRTIVASLEPTKKSNLWSDCYQYYFNFRK